MEQILWDATVIDQSNPEKRFLPRRSLESICNFNAVLATLEEIWGHDEARTYTDFICNGNHARFPDTLTTSRQIFAILVLIGELRMIRDFYHNCITDDALPLQYNDGHTALRTIGNGSLSFFQQHPQDARLMTEFYNKQWWVHVPFFARNETEADLAAVYPLAAGTVLPWTFISAEVETGGFAKVYQVQIHQDQHEFPEYSNFALKIYHAHGNTEDDFNREIDAFRKMSPNAHLLTLCAILVVGDKYMLLFPWAEGGSLKSLWRKPATTIHPCQDNGITWSRWMATECHGLARALQTIHRQGQDRTVVREDSQRYGIHGDIKPENILYFSQDTQHHDLGSLQIADFNMLKFHGVGSRSARNEKTAGAASQTYRSPEYDITQEISRKVDIWALGCVFSELMTWMILGSDAISEYQKRRLAEPSYSGFVKHKGQWSEDNFFIKHIERPSPARILDYAFHADNDSTSEEPLLKCSVAKWIDELIKASGGANTFCIDMLNFIKVRMLHPKREERAGCDEVERFFQQCLEKAPADNAYWCARQTNGATFGIQENGNTLPKRGLKLPRRLTLRSLIKR